MGATAIKITGNTTVITFLLCQWSNSKCSTIDATFLVTVVTTKPDRLPRRPARKEQKISYRMVGNKIAAHVMMDKVLLLLWLPLLFLRMKVWHNRQSRFRLSI